MKMLVAASLFLAPSSLAAAQSTIHVPADQPTIQDGIGAAQAGDTVLVAPGTYNEQIDLLGKAITLRSTGGASNTIIDSEGRDDWPDFPFGPVVRMINTEGASTVIEGFTITGGETDGIGSAGYCGVWCDGLTPTLRDCRITGNSGGLGGGVTGSPTLERCEITGNDSLPYGDGGGVRGAPIMRDCVVSNNRSGGVGGGIYVTGPCVIEDCIIQENIAGNGFDGYTGGGVFGPADLIGCVITGNSAHHFLSGGPPDEVGSGVDGANSIRRCTIANNFVANSAGLPIQPGGGVRNVATIVDSIIWSNEDNEFAASSTPNVTYSTVMGGYPGTGNSSADPMFLNAAAGDFLQLGSPAIDAGDPASPLDPDGTRADMGALFFPQFPATAVVRNGTGVNPSCYQTTDTPVIGSTWTATVDATAHGFSGTMVRLYAYSQPSAPMLFPFGEILVDTASGRLGTVLAPAVAGTATFPLPLPTDYSLGGLTIASQAVVFGGGVGLCNAIDLVLGL